MHDPDPHRLHDRALMQQIAKMVRLRFYPVDLEQTLAFLAFQRRALRVILQAQLSPQGVDLPFNLGAGHDGAPPFPVGFAFPFFGRVQAHL